MCGQNAHPLGQNARPSVPCPVIVIKIKFNWYIIYDNTNSIQPKIWLT